MIEWAAGHWVRRKIQIPNSDSKFLEKRIVTLCQKMEIESHSIVTELSVAIKRE